MSIPITRRFSSPGAGVVGVPQIMTDNETTLAFFLSGPNVILDVVNDPDPAAGNFYTIAVFSGSIDTGVRFYSNAMSPLVTGRLPMGPIALKGGQYQFRVTQTAGVAAILNILVKFQRPP